MLAYGEKGEIMGDLILYLALASVGYVIATKLRDRKEKLAWTGKIQTVAITLLVFTMGTRMGSNDEVIQNLKSIGLYSLLITVIIMSMSVGAVFLARKIMKINRYGTMGPVTEEEAEYYRKKHSGGEGKASKGVDKMTIFIVCAVLAGMAIGYFVVNKVFTDYAVFDALASNMIKLGLCILLFFVGLDLGLDGTVVANFKKVGARVLVFPAATIIGSMLGAVVCGIILPISMKESLAVGGGLGWYSLAPGIIMEAGYVTASAIAFMHNVMRELLSILIIPIVAKHIGYIETTAMPGAAAMDVCLPIVEKSTSSNIAVYSLVSGVILSAAVPVIEPIILGL